VIPFRSLFPNVSIQHRSGKSDCRETEEEYRRLGETIVTVSGTLISGPWHCDRCNARLKKGAAATLMTAFPRNCAAELADYDYGNERQYFRVEQAAVTAYGELGKTRTPW
jgi:hypothetical protein